MGNVDFYEKQSNGSLTPIGMYEVQADGSLVLLTFVDTGDLAVPDPPTILTGSGSSASAMLTRTSAQINWVASTGGVPAVNWEVLRDGVQVSADLPSSTLTFTETGLPTATPERIFNYTVRALGSNGQQGGLSNAVALQWNSTPVQPPAAPTSLTASAITDTGFTLTWAESTLTGMREHTVRQGTGGTILKSGIGATATTTNVTGLSQNTTYSGTYVTRTRDSDGVASGPSPTVSPRTTGGTGVAHDPVMGTSASDENHGGIGNWPGWRIYKMDQNTSYTTAGGAVADGARVIALTGNQGSPTFTPSETTANVQTKLGGFLDWFYYGTGSANRQSCEIHFATDNETDRNFGSVALPSGYVNCVSASRDVIHTLNANGTRRYPLASLWADFTHSNIDQATVARNFKAIARYLDGFACSMYPPGRDMSKNGGQPAWTAYSTYTDGVMNVVQDWMATGGVGGGPSPITSFATWEIGMPIDHAYYDVGGNNTTSTIAGEPTSLTDFSRRPRYFCAGRDATGATGTNWVGYLQYVYNKLDAMGCIMREQLYWDQMLDVAKPNPLSHDTRTRAWNDPGSSASGTTRANPDTATAWKAWTPGSRLADG